MTNDKLKPCELIERFSRCEKDILYVYWIHRLYSFFSVKEVISRIKLHDFVID